MKTIQYLSKRIQAVLHTAKLHGWSAVVDNFPSVARDSYLSYVDSWLRGRHGISFELVPKSIVSLGEKIWRCEVQRVNRAISYFWCDHDGCRVSYFSVSDARNCRLQTPSDVLSILNAQQLLDQLKAVDHAKALMLFEDGRSQSLVEYLGIAGHVTRLAGLHVNVLQISENRLAAQIVGFETPVSIEFATTRGSLIVFAIGGEPTHDFFIRRSRLWGKLNNVT